MGIGFSQRAYSIGSASDTNRVASVRSAGGTVAMSLPMAGTVQRCAAAQRPGAMLLPSRPTHAFGTRLARERAPQVVRARWQEQHGGTPSAPAAERHAPVRAPWLAATLLSVGAPLTLAARALAEPLNSSVGAKQFDEAVQQAAPQVDQVTQQAAQAAQQAGAQIPAPVEALLVASPLLVYGLFYVFRSKVNPRAKLSDFAFIFAGLVIVFNLFSILVFKVRFF